MAAEQSAQPKAEKRAKAGKRWLTFLILSVCGTGLAYLMTACSKEPVLPAHTAAFYINDYSRVFSESTETFLREQGEALYQSTGAQIVAVSVPTTYSDSIETFSLDLARDWAIGSADQDNGVLLLFTTDEAHVRLEIGRGLEGCLNDAKCGRILDDYAVEAMHAGEWNRAVMQTWIATAEVVYAEYGQTAPVALNDLPEIDESAAAATSADATLPDPVSALAEYTVPVRILSCFMAFWIMFAPLWLLIWLFTRKQRTRTSGSRSYSGTYSSSSSYSSSDSDSYSSSSSSSSGNFGGGGSFGGGGATR